MNIDIEKFKAILELLENAGAQAAVLPVLIFLFGIAILFVGLHVVYQILHYCLDHSDYSKALWRIADVVEYKPHKPDRLPSRWGPTDTNNLIDMITKLTKCE